MSKIGIWGSLIVIALMIGISFYGWTVIPEDAVLARHWDINGAPNGYSPRNHILIGMPALAAILSLLFYIIPKIDPRPDHVRQSAGLLAVGWLGALALLLLVHAAVIVAAVRGGDNLPAPGLLLYALCLFLILIGNYTAKTRSNFSLGIRTPWTLSSEHAWGVANRTAGWLFVLTGLGAGATGAFLGDADGYKVLLAGALTTAVVSIVISYFAWRADPERQNAR